MKRFNAALLLGSRTCKKEAVDWCNRHGINPDLVPLDAQIEILDEERLELEVYDTTSAGAKQWDEKSGAPKMRWLLVEYRDPIPEGLLEDG